MVHGVVRGRIELEGSTIRSYEVASRPVAFPGVLIWRSPHGRIYLVDQTGTRRL